jgi:TATA-box binding protein (TBP) (component of TFIID and TFIIIB)
MALPYAPKVTNVVCTASLSCTLSRQALQLLAFVARGRYDHKIFPPCVIRLKRPVKVTLEVFSTGKVTACGARTIGAARVGFYVLAAYISRIWRQPVSLRNVKIENLVATTRKPYRINIPLFHADHPSPLSFYQPKRFSGLKYYANGDDQCVLLFMSGACVTTGNTSTRGAQQSIETVPLERYAVGSEYRAMTQDEISTTLQKFKETKKAKRAEEGTS